MSHLVCISHSHPSVSSSPSEASTLYVLPDKYFTSLKIVLPIFSSSGATSRWNLMDGMEDNLQIWSSTLGRFAPRLGSFSTYLVNHVCMEGSIGTGMGTQSPVSGHEFSSVQASVYPSVKCSGRLGLFFQSFQLNMLNVSIWSSEVNIHWSRSGPFDETFIFKPGDMRIWAVGRVPCPHMGGVVLLPAAFFWSHFPYIACYFLVVFPPPLPFRLIYSLATHFLL